jgi:molybdopterin-guanine dinucleotide biosynthesis protein A
MREPSIPNRLLGAVIAGGMSRRFGSDKALALFEGRTMIAHAVAMLEREVGRVVICGRAESIAGLPWLADRPAPDLGPLGGISAALHFARDEGFGAVLTLGCDMPRLPPDLFGMLRAAGPSAFIAEAPIIGLWSVALADPLDAHLRGGGDRSIRRWAMQAGVTCVTLGEDLPNINTRADLANLAGVARESAAE